LHPEVLETQQLIDKYSQDITKAKCSIMRTSNIPHFPESEWEHVLRGHTVNLGNVISGINTMSSITPRTHHIGELEITLPGTSSSTKHILNSREWFSAWQLTTEAMLRAFPHQCTELTLYG
ncbi:hypothetical protein BDQ17DRAFT_1252108, partial [Cyathus striatus]